MNLVDAGQETHLALHMCFRKSVPLMRTEIGLDRSRLARSPLPSAVDDKGRAETVLERRRLWPFAIGHQALLSRNRHDQQHGDSCGFRQL